jgi:hypothetical protein
MRTGRRTALGLIAVALAGTALALPSGSSEAKVDRRCHADPRPPLAGDVPGTADEIGGRGRRIVRRAAHNPHTTLAHLLGGSRYRVTQLGTVTNGGPSKRYHRTFRITGALVDIRLERPHPVDAIAPDWAGGWPRRSRYYKYSRHLGYVPYRYHLASPKLVDLMLGVDMRTHRINEILAGLHTETSGYRIVPGHCPLRPAPDED